MLNWKNYFKRVSMTLSKRCCLKRIQALLTLIVLLQSFNYFANTMLSHVQQRLYESIWQIKVSYSVKILCQRYTKTFWVPPDAKLGRMLIVIKELNETKKKILTCCCIKLCCTKKKIIPGKRGCIKASQRW